MGWFTSFLYSQLFVTLPVPTADFSGQTIIITGSNTGLGLEAARHLSRLHCTLLILAVRSQPKGIAAKKSILESTNRAEDSIEVWDLDMQSYASIQAFCARVNKLPRLDAVIENAGIMTKYFKIVAGYESVITTNVIGTFLLALGLLPKMKESAKKFGTKGRLAVVASDLHFIAKFPEAREEDIFGALNDEKSSEMGMERYATSKLLQVFAVRELASRMGDASKSETSSVIINCMTPGACVSDFDRESKGLAVFMNKIMYAFIARTTEAGSRTLIAAITADEENQGGYMADCKVVEPGPSVLGEKGKVLQKKVWEQLVRQLETIQPGISRNI